VSVFAKMQTGDGRAIPARLQIEIERERCLRAAGAERGVAGQQLDRIVDRQMRAIRQVVTDLDVSGTPQGGRA
jgi:hypothetical protein